MATILLNGVAFDAANVTDNNDKLTVSGGNSDALDVNLAGGDDLIEVFAENGNFTNTTLRGGEGDDVLTAVAGFQDPDNLSYVGAVSFAQSMVGGPGEDTITVGDGLVSITGIAKGNEDDDTFTVANINGGTVQGNSGDDSITIGFAPGFGTAAGSLAAASVTNGTVNGGQGADDITIDDGVTVTGSAVRGNEGNDDIFISDEAVISADSTINGNAGKDDIDAAGAGAFSVLGGAGHDILRIGSGQTAVGGKGADTFSIEAEGGATITDYDNDDDADCFCDDVIQVDGNKLEYDTYEYKLGYKDYTSASSWKGNIKVKAVADKVECTVEAEADYSATKTESLKATAVIAYKVTELKTSLEITPALYTNVNPVAGVNWYTRGTSLIPNISYPAQGTRPTVTAGGKNGAGIVQDNGNEPRTNTAPFDADHIVEGIGFGYAKVTGYWTDQDQSGGARTNYGFIRSALAYTRTSFAKGDFSFLGLTTIAYDDCEIKQTLVFDDISNATITNHWRSYVKEKSSYTTSLYALSFGTANFGAVVTGKANLMISKGFVDQTFDKVIKSYSDKGINIRTNSETWNRKDINYTDYNFVRSKNVDALDAKVSLNLEGTFDAYVIRNEATLVSLTDGMAATTTNYNNAYVVTATGPGGVGTAQWMYYPGINWNQAGRLGIRTLSVATSIFGKSRNTYNNIAEATGIINTQQVDFFDTLAGTRTTATYKQQALIPASKQTVALRTNFSNPNAITVRFAGNNQGLRDTSIATGTLQVKIAVDGVAIGGTNPAIDPSMNIWVDRAVIPKQTFDITSCTFPTTIYNNRGDNGDNNVHNKVTPAYVPTGNSNVEQTGEFNTRYLWNAGDMRAAQSGNVLSDYVTTTQTVGGGTSFYYPISSLRHSNGCFDTFSCTDTATRGLPQGSLYVNAADAVPTLNAMVNGPGRALAANQGFFSGSEWSVDVLAAAGMGDNVQVRNPNSNAADTVISTAVGAPFRVLFFDTKGSDNGLYIYSGTANYKAGDVTAINTDPQAVVNTKSSGTTNSYFGGKETIVKVTGGKGHEIALSDINFV